MSSYCGLVDAKIRASDKDLPVTGLGGLKKLQQTGYWEAASRILGSLKKGKCGLFEGGGY